MLNVRTSGWCRIEGCEISNLDREYGVLHNIPNNEQHIYYGHPEIQIENPYSTIHSTVYCVKPIDTILVLIDKKRFITIAEANNNALIIIFFFA